MTSLDVARRQPLAWPLALIRYNVVPSSASIAVLLSTRIAANLPSHPYINRFVIYIYISFLVLFNTSIALNKSSVV